MKKKFKVSYEGAVNLIDKCLKDEIKKICYGVNVTDDERKDAIDFLFGSPVEEFIDVNDIKIDINKLREGVFRRIVSLDMMRELLYGITKETINQTLSINQSEAI